MCIVLALEHHNNRLCKETRLNTDEGKTFENNVRFNIKALWTTAMS